MSDVWRGPDGQPLKFQEGDCVQIDTSRNLSQVYDLPFLKGYVRGYNISGDSVAYELFWMGAWLRFVKEDCLDKIPDRHPHGCPPGRCSICGGTG